LARVQSFTENAFRSQQICRDLGIHQRDDLGSAAGNRAQKKKLNRFTIAQQLTLLFCRQIKVTDYFARDERIAVDKSPKRVPPIGSETIQFSTLEEYSLARFEIGTRWSM
jgi:hypothetical protein